MKKFFIAVLIVSVLLFFPVTARAEGNIRTENDINISDWSCSSGNAPRVAVSGGANDGIYLSGEGSGEVFSCGYGREVPSRSVMADFSAETYSGGYSGKTEVIFSFGKDGAEYFRFVFTLREGGYDAAFIVGDESYSLSGMKYKEEGHIQFRIAREEVRDYDSGEIYETWNMILGIQKSAAPKNDKYNTRVNRYESEDFAAISDALDEAVTENGVYLTVFARSDSEAGIGVTVRQISYFCFYDYAFLDASRISVNKLDYTNIGFSFTLPENGFEVGGFVIERYKGEVLDKTFVITNAYADSISDTQLKQNTEYRYVITALKNVSSTNRTACSTISFKYEELKLRTQKGYLWKLFAGVAVFVASCAAFVLLYVFFNDIKKILKR
ncbi:MAG: hypothetical protein IJU84_02095 [Clostridia bacterium]|nr:hypothetical protein [Clostridia bacterium]MBQ9480939.1 hypothetical protein [Clostridia bacterium]